MNEMLLLLVLGAGVIAGVVISSRVYLHRLDSALAQLEESDREMHRMLREQLRPAHEQLRPLAHLEMQDAASRTPPAAPGEHLENVTVSAARASNDALAHAYDVPGIIRKRPVEPTAAPARRFSLPRGCSFCARVRAAFTRSGP